MSTMGCRAAQWEQEEVFFFEKKNQKTFAPTPSSTGA
jgi:hypothetical protein